ncbi:MAG: hypothetical protein CMP33_07280 [Rickettsiales bacterium]|nr:hypothetical protein [Rickettsiales bacterium]|tara:strand:+ start:637 stop:1398 length:762 start_codon:yes stop_codon:yes gene_type:complete
MKKVVFSRTELHKFLLMGDPGKYIIDKIHPSIRAIKRKEVLAIFCTLRINRRTTSVKLGQFPENNLDEIYAKFQIARNISTNGNNPNFYLKEISDRSTENQTESIDNLTIEYLVKVFLNNKKLSQKYSYDFTNCLKNNFGEKYKRPLKDFSRKDFTNRIKYLNKESKLGTLNNFVYKTNKLFLYFLKNGDYRNQQVLKDVLSIIPSIIAKYVKIMDVERKTNSISRITKALRKLDSKQLKKIEYLIKEKKIYE